MRKGGFKFFLQPQQIRESDLSRIQDILKVRVIEHGGVNHGIMPLKSAIRKFR
jgi:translation initiation factor 6 (eIF-6)